MPQVEGLYFQTACVNQFMPQPGLSTPDMFVYRSHSSNVPFLCGTAGPRTVTSEAVSDPRPEHPLTPQKPASWEMEAWSPFGNFLPFHIPDLS